MLRCQFHRLPDVRLPAGKSLLRQAVDQVEVEVIEAGLARPAHRIEHIEWVVDAFKLAQFPGLERLDSETDPVETGLPQPAQGIQRDRSGVGFKRGLQAGRVRQVKAVAYRLEDLLKLRRGQQGRRAAAEENGMGRQTIGTGGSHAAHFITKPFHISGNQALLPSVGVKVAVGAAVGAEGDVEVKRVIRCHVFRIQCGAYPGLLEEPHFNNVRLHHTAS